MAEMLDENSNERENDAVSWDKMWLRGTLCYPLVDVETYYWNTLARLGANASHASGEQLVSRYLYGVDVDVEPADVS